MDTINQQPTPEEQTTPTFSETKKGGLGPILGIIVIIILLALGGYYYFTQGIDQIPDYSNPEAEIQSAEQEAAALEEQGTSTNLADIEADLNATDLSGLDEASADFESELNAQ